MKTSPCFATDTNLASLLHRKTKQHAPALRIIPEEVFREDIEKKRIIILSGKKNGDILAALRCIDRGKDTLEVGSVWSETRGGAGKLFDFLLSQDFIASRQLALITQQTNNAMCRLARKNGFYLFSPLSAFFSSGLRQCLYKDIGGNPPVPDHDRVLFVRPVSPKAYSTDSASVFSTLPNSA